MTHLSSMTIIPRFNVTRHRTPKHHGQKLPEKAKGHYAKTPAAGEQAKCACSPAALVGHVKRAQRQRITHQGAMWCGNPQKPT